MKTIILFICSTVLFLVLSFVSLSIAKEQTVSIEWPQLVIALGYVFFGIFAYFLADKNGFGKWLVIAPVVIFLVVVIYQFGLQITSKKHAINAANSISIEDYQHEPIFLDGTQKLIGLKVTLKIISKDAQNIKLAPPIFYSQSETPSRVETHSSLNKEVLRDVSIISNKLNVTKELTYLLYPSPIAKYRSANSTYEEGGGICIKTNENLGFIGKPKHIDFQAYSSGAVVNIGDQLLAFFITNDINFSQIEKLEKANARDLGSKLRPCQNY